MDNKEKYFELIQAAIDSEPIIFKEIFDELMEDKLSEAVDEVKNIVTYEMFNKEQEEDDE